MPGRLREWPDWPEFTFATSEVADDLISYKTAIIEQYGEESLTQSWLKVCKELEKITDDLAERGSSAIPEIQYDEFFDMSAERKQQLKDVGCFVVRNVFDKEQADQWFLDLKEYVAANRPKIRGWPKETPFILNLYYSPTQIAARSHPNQLRLSRELNSWWRDSTGTSSPSPVSYADGVRIRPPGIPFKGLGPHIDAGSLSRWADPTYRSVYDAVFAGRPEGLDNYDLTVRQHADMKLFPGSAHSRVFRAFQGWTALTAAGPHEGSLMLFPHLKWTIAYVLLRPFFSPPPTTTATADNSIPDDTVSETETVTLDPTKWTFDPATPYFPGTFKAASQELSPRSHPHLRLRECMVSIPPMRPGDTIWWHADMCHAVEVEHEGDHDASVAYIAAAPETAENKRYVRRQLADFLDGVPPEDFRNGSAEREFALFTGEKAILGGAEGRRAFGYGL